VVAFDKNGLRVTFALEKPAADNPGLTAITATYTNGGLEDVEGFTLQVRAGLGGAGWRLRWVGVAWRGVAWQQVDKAVQ